MSDHEARLAHLEIQGVVGQRLAALVEAGDLDRTLPKLARGPSFTRWIDGIVQSIAVQQELIQADSRHLPEMQNSSVHLVLTSPPYWTLKRYNEHPAQLGRIDRYDVFLDELDRVWRHCYRQVRDDRFEVEGDYLVRHATPSRGRPYVHRCPKRSYELLAHVAEEIGGEGFTVESLVEAADIPSSQVAVALAFWKERGVVETRHPRRNYATSDDWHLDAMVEYYALLEKGSGSGSE